MVYQRLCDLHIEVCQLTRSWPPEEKYELTSQIRRSSNSSPANLAEKHNDRHVKNKIEGVNRSRGEAHETIHHSYIALRKTYVENNLYESLRGRYDECIRMLNGLERAYEQQIDPASRVWPSQDSPSTPNL